ncbi:hypothetical protein KPL70_001278 [Citrus sinensis]|uniref:Uncharacterized protein n=1 Tax=Citrus sinensis TaxID=2711 RepID=A0ACB8NW72_CITSI|nr:hypothetical protein KPL70_001278 [Citrus sinensis]KAH9802290.1 hypothetical protein KPL71_001328 [Citrus sinensis]
MSKGACASETTSDGQTALASCWRMTKRKDYIEATKQGQETSKDRLCIDVLEREMRRNSMSGNLALSSEVMADDFQMKLNYLENRGDISLLVLVHHLLRVCSWHTCFYRLFAPSS